LTGAAENRRMLQALLAEHFKLALHRETKPLPSYALVIAENGIKLHPVQSVEGVMAPGGRTMGGHQMKMALSAGQVMGIAAQRASVVELARPLAMQLGNPVANKTGLTGNYDFTPHWDPNRSSRPMKLTPTRRQPVSPRPHCWTAFTSNLV